MSSATPIAVNRFALANQALDADRIARVGMTPRQVDLNRKWAFYKAQQYESRSINWDGYKVVSDLERESMASVGQVPAAFWDPTSKMDEMPLSLRRPLAPYHIVRVIVNRFSGLLFSDGMQPKVSVLGGDESMQQWLDGLLETTRMWSRWDYARNIGGGQGSVAVTFQFQNGQPIVEVHDSRWCFPTITNKITGEMSKLEIRYQYPVEQPNEHGVVKEVWFWYRRIIDTVQDIEFEPAPVGDGDEPKWVVARQVPHNLGEFPGVWVRNTQTDEIDGEADAEGLYDTAEQIDGLLSQSTLGSRENADPTFVVASQEFKQGDVRKGSGNGIHLKDGTASYAEMTGSGVASALAVAKELRRNALEVAQVVLETESEVATTATEIERRYSSMHDRGAKFREQYGEHGIKPLIGKIIRAVLRLRTGTKAVDGTLAIGQVFMSPVEKEGKLCAVDLPKGMAGFNTNHIRLKWPQWVKRGPGDAQAAASAVGAARSSTIIDRKNAVEYLAPYFQIENVDEAIERIEQESSGVDADMVGDLLARQQQNATPTLLPPAATPAAPAPAAEVTKVADTAMNGAQIQAAMQILTSVADKTLAADAAVYSLVAFLQVDEALARKMVTAQVAKAVAAPPSGMPPFMGGGA